MEYRELGRTGWKISTVGLGTWAMGSSWGAVDDTQPLATLNRALDLGVNIFDTADAYGSEHIRPDVEYLWQLAKRRAAGEAGRLFDHPATTADARYRLDRDGRDQDRSGDDVLH